MGRAKQKIAVTARLSVYEKRNFNDTIDNLTERHRLALPCPLGAEDLVALWCGNMDDVDRNFWRAAQVKLIRGDNLPFIEPDSQGVLLDFGFARLCLQIPKTVFDGAKLPIWNRQSDMSLVNPQHILGDELYASLRDWAKVAVHIHTRVEMTKLILKKITGIANTVGQLNRMAPELVKYSSALTQQALGEQERRSPLPDEWMQLDRMLVRTSLDHLTFCYLLPKVEDQPDADAAPWIWDSVGAATAALFTSRPSREAGARLDTYKLPFDPNPMELGTFSPGKLT